MRVESGEFIRSVTTEDGFLRDGRPEVAFVGRSNVGKSSLLNRLLGRSRLARTSAEPGRTQAANYFLINSSFYFVDLPGYGYAKVSKKTRRDWAQLMQSYFASTRPYVVQLVDAKVGATALDVEARRYFESLGGPSVIAATKADRLAGGRQPLQMQAIRTELGLGVTDRVVPVSARTGEGIADLWKEIEAFLAAAGRGRARNGGRS